MINTVLSIMSRSKNPILLLVVLADILTTICIASMFKKKVWYMIFSAIAGFIVGCIILSKPTAWRVTDKGMAIYGVFIAEFSIMAVVAVPFTLYLTVETVISSLTPDPYAKKQEQSGVPGA